MDLLQYQEYLANTAHQREVADLKAAGLNPILSAHGSGAAVPNVLTSGGSAAGESAVGSVLKVANNAVKTSAKAVSALGSVGSSLSALGKLDLSSSPLQAIESVEQASSGSSSSGSGTYVTENGILGNFINDYVEEHGSEHLFGASWAPTVKQTADLIKFINKKPGHALSDEEWQVHESAKSNYNNSRKPWSSSTARQLQDDAAVARLLLGR